MVQPVVTLTTRRIMNAIRTQFQSQFNSELMIGDAVIRQIEALPAGLYGSLIFVAMRSVEGDALRTGQAEVEQVFDISIGMRTESDDNALLTMYDTIDTIVGWLKYQRFGLSGIAPIGANDVVVNKREDTESPNVFSIVFTLQSLRGGVLSEILPDDGESVTSINLNPNNVGYRQIFRSSG